MARIHYLDEDVDQDGLATDDHPPTKYMRFTSSDDEQNTPCLNQPRQKASLDNLPTELLVMILDCSLEPSLIHTSRKFWYNLPGYTSYAKTLALNALMPAHVSPNPRVPRPHHPKEDADLARIERSLNHDCQTRIRKAVFSSTWFQHQHLEHIHQNLIHSAILKACVWHTTDAPSRGQLRRIRHFVASDSTIASTTQLNLRLRGKDGRPMNLNSSSLAVSLTAQHTASVFTSVSFRVLDFDGIVPDIALRDPLNTNNLKLIQHIADAASRGRLAHTRIVCNRKLLHNAFLEAIVHDQSLAFFTLLTLEGLSQDEGDVALDGAHLGRAVEYGRSRMLIAILKRMWSYPRRHKPSDADLVALTTRAKSVGYPDWTKTTRILAMEVASMWKAAEIEEQGGEVSHIPHRWPPELKITSPGQMMSQSWFIPKDFRHDVDWENCLVGPWRPAEMYKGDFAFLSASAFAMIWPD